MMESQVDGLIFAAKIISSAKNKCDCEGPFGDIGIGCQAWWSAAVLIWRDSISRHSMKRYGDRGSPWRIPLVGLKYSVRLPLIDWCWSYCNTRHDNFNEIGWEVKGD